MFDTFEPEDVLEDLDFIWDRDICNDIINVLIAWLGYAAISRNVDMCIAVMASVRLLFSFGHRVLE